jgi:hypothetical protein
MKVNILEVRNKKSQPKNYQSHITYTGEKTSPAPAYSVSHPGPDHPGYLCSTKDLEGYFQDWGVTDLTKPEFGSPRHITLKGTFESHSLHLTYNQIIVFKVGDDSSPLTLAYRILLRTNWSANHQK